MLFRSRSPLSIRELAEQFKKSFWVSVSQASQFLLASTDVLIIGAVLGPAAVVPYAATSKVLSFASNFPKAIAEASVPALSELRASNDKPRLRKATSSLLLGMMTLSGAIACLLLTANRAFVEWWLGAASFGGQNLNVLLCANMLAQIGRAHV